jgi:hypothetical protein
LKLDEIYNFYPHKDREKVETELNYLLEKSIIFKVGDYYLTDCDPECIEKRQRGNAMAAGALIKAEDKAAFISKFPFVEAVGVSGSLSKGYYDDKSDIDFFVITKPNKVWIARTFLMLYKKIFLLNSRKYFCINYFMSAADLEVQEKNRFTATEIRTLIPFQGKKALTEFYKSNGWVSSMFGAFCPGLDNIPNIKKPLPVKLAEVILDNKLGDLLDHAFKSVTLQFWTVKFRKMERDDFKVALKSTKNVSKHHPLNFQKKVILSLNDKYDELRQKHNIVLQKEYV